MNPDDERSKLIFTFLDVVERVKPRAFVMENVKALGVLEKWESVRQEYIQRASKLGYFCMPFVLNATEYNVPQKEVFLHLVLRLLGRSFEYLTPNARKSEKKIQNKL